MGCTRKIQYYAAHSVIGGYTRLAFSGEVAEYMSEIWFWERCAGRLNQMCTLTKKHICLMCVNRRQRDWCDLDFEIILKCSRAKRRSQIHCARARKTAVKCKYDWNVENDTEGVVHQTRRKDGCPPSHCCDYSERVRPCTAKLAERL